MYVYILYIYIYITVICMYIYIYIYMCVYVYVHTWSELLVPLVNFITEGSENKTCIINPFDLFFLF